ncbi:histidine phosphatase family protein [Novosphingobium lentum]|uniref:histidine phosphatase family protein n=1 Tax=Novosphingobium lentum TaxID=145287 RepID=UPI0008322155|nr:phosphoglycerate mutase family protein [Novosphingobium lentum]
MTTGRFFIMRHGETVYNATHRLQSNTMHTPLTALGCAQAVTMGVALRAALGPAPQAALHVSETGRTLQTASLLCQELDFDWFAARRDVALWEIDMGSWCGRSYGDVEAEFGPIMDADHLLTPAPDGEDYPAIAARLARWLGSVADAQLAGGDHIVVMHGISSRVLRGMMARYPVHPTYGVPIAPSLVQGSIAMIEVGVENGRETVLLGAERGIEHA